MFDEMCFQFGGSPFVKMEGEGRKEREREGQIFLKIVEMKTVEQQNINRSRDRFISAQKQFWCTK